MFGKCAVEQVVLEQRDSPRAEISGICPSGRSSHLFRAVDSRQMTGRKFIADQRYRVSVTTADLEDKVVRPDFEYANSPRVSFGDLSSHLD